MNQKILVIEDNREMLENISDILKLASYDVIGASNGKEGIQLAQSSSPDLILCDIVMPEHDGYEVLHILNKNKKTSDIPFIFLSAKAEKSDFRTGMNLGADDYLVKPFDGHELLTVIEKSIQKNHMLKTSFRDTVWGQGFIEFKDRESKELSKLIKGKQKRTFYKKEIIYNEGDTAHDIFFISNGLLKTFKSSTDGKELITGLHGPGSFLGYVSILGNVAYTESAFIMDESEVFQIPKNEFLNTLGTNKEISTYFLMQLSNRLIKSEEFMVDLAYASNRQRTASVLNRLHEQFHNSQDLNSFIELSRKDISYLVGTATESLNRCLAEFRDEKIIELCPEGIRILDFPKLKKIIY